MSKQIYNISNNVSTIEITKNGIKIFEVQMIRKTIDLKSLYNNMQVQIDDELVFDDSLTKYTAPKTDSERIFNNIYEFLNDLFDSLNKKLDEIKKREETDVFK